MPTDAELLRQFADARDEAAFAELVRRQADFVYSVARRVTVSDALAQEVTQAVFAQVARQAARLAGHGALEGWLHTTARNLAINTVRGEARRRAREQEALAMEINSPTPEAHWDEIGPLLDEAVGALPGDDRQAVLLRFFKNLSHREVGAALGVNEDAARKRVDRALEKLRTQFAQRGVTASSALLSSAIIENSMQAAPVGLVASLTSVSLAGVGNVVTSGALLAALFMTTKPKTILAAIIVLAIVAALALKWQSSNETSVPSTAGQLQVAVSMPKTPGTQVVAPTMAPVVVRDPAISSNNAGALAAAETANSLAGTRAAALADLTSRVNLLIQGRQVILGTSPDIWETIPGRANAIKLREGVKTIPLVQDHVNGLYDTVYYLPAEERFYIDWRPGPDQGGCYGPFLGSPYDVLNLPAPEVSDGPYIVIDATNP